MAHITIRDLRTGEHTTYTDLTPRQIENRRKDYLRPTHIVKTNTKTLLEFYSEPTLEEWS